ncbi:hypothetical protein ACIRPQ_21700 [Streptomyces sp. NPDC101213]
MRAAPARADTVTDKIHAELHLCERLSDHGPHCPNYHVLLPDWMPTPTP